MTMGSRNDDGRAGMTVRDGVMERKDKSEILRFAIASLEDGRNRSGKWEAESEQLCL